MHPLLTATCWSVLLHVCRVEELHEAVADADSGCSVRAGPDRLFVSVHDAVMHCQSSRSGAHAALQAQRTDESSAHEGNVIAPATGTDRPLTIPLLNSFA